MPTDDEALHTAIMMMLHEVDEMLEWIEDHMGRCDIEGHWAERAALMQRKAIISEELKKVQSKSDILDN